jgi:PPP family 3-phenylpropionic acid transporter
MTAAGPPGAPPCASPAAPLARFGALSACYFAAVGLFNPYAPLWFQSLGFSTLLIGGIASLQNWTRVVAPYAWSWCGDRSGRRVQLIRISAAATLLATLGLLGVREAVPVALLTGLIFLANSGIAPLSEAALLHLLQRPDAQDGMDARRYGRVRVWGSVGFIVAVTVFGALLQRLGIAIFPVFVAAMDGLLLLAALRLPAAREAAVHFEPAPPVWPLLRQPRVAWFFASVFFTVLAHNSLYAFFSLYLVSLGYDKAAVGALWAASVAVEIVVFWTQGRWFGRLSTRGWLQAAGGVTALRFAATAAGGAWPPVLVLAQMTHAVTFGAHHAACIAMVHRLFTGRLRGRGQALYTTLGYGVPGVLGGVGGGWIISQAGFAAVFWAAALCGLAAWACARRAPA